MQRVAFGVQTPLQVPVVQMNWHAVSSTHFPLASQCWGVRSLHCRVFGVHAPAHVPALQTFVHATPLVHCPSLPHD